MGYVKIYLRALAVTTKHKDSFRAEFLHRYADVYAKKPGKLRTVTFEQHLKQEMRALQKMMVFGKPGYNPSEFFELDQPHGVLLEKKPEKRLNTYQILRTLREMKL